MNQISRELPNGFVPNSQKSRIWSLAQTTLNVKVKDQRSRSPETKKTGCALPLPPTATEWIALAENNVTRHSVAARGDFGGLRAVCVNFGKTSLTLVFSEREL